MSQRTNESSANQRITPVNQEIHGRSIRIKIKDPPADQFMTVF